MSIAEAIKEFLQPYVFGINRFFEWYNSISRGVLDFFHNVFDSSFNAFLGIAVFVSVIYLILTIYALFHKKTHRKEESYDGELPFVSVQIPTFNEIVALRCAQKCLEFDYPKNKYEIIIGDDSNNQQISGQIREFAEANNIKVLKRPSNIGFKPANLNNMLRHSKGEIIVIFDSDFAPDNDFLSRIIVPFMKDEKIAGVQARWRISNPNQNLITALGTAIVYTFHYITLPFVQSNRKMTVLCGSAEAVRKKTLIKLGGWESGNLTEDIEYSLRLFKNGYRIEYIDDLQCDSEVPYTTSDLCKQQMRWAYGVIYSWKKHFSGIVKSSKMATVDKFYMPIIFCSGYLLSLILMGLFATGLLSLITHAPEPVNWARFFYELGRNILLTSGLILASVVALTRANKKKLVWKMVASSFSYGLVVTYYVNVGIIKAISNYPMKWYMLKKLGNKEF